MYPLQFHAKYFSYYFLIGVGRKEWENGSFLSILGIFKYSYILSILAFQVFSPFPQVLE